MLLRLLMFLKPKNLTNFRNLSVLNDLKSMLFKILGAIGLLFITYGVITKKAVLRNVVFIIGGMFLLSYSTYLKDPIFIPLQIIFTLASIYELLIIRKKR